METDRIRIEGDRKGDYVELTLPEAIDIDETRVMVTGALSVVYREQTGGVSE